MNDDGSTYPEPTLGILGIQHKVKNENMMGGNEKET